MATGSLTVVGTGFCAPGQTTPEALGHLREAEKVFYVVADPLARMWIESLSPTAESLADSYAVGKPRRDTYREMVERILAPVREGKRVCAAFYGHPGVFVEASHQAVRQARREGFAARMLPGISAADCLFADLGLDPSAHGCQSFEASDFLLRRRRFDPRSALILWQIGAIGVSVYMDQDLWSRQGLGILAETLLQHYDAGHETVVYEAAMAPVCEPVIRRVPLAELPAAEVTVASTLYVPPREPAPRDPEMAERLDLSHPR